MKTKNHKEFYIKTGDEIKIALNHFDNKNEDVLIIANGWTMSKDSKFISEIANHFAKKIDVISFDFRGHGKSSGLYTFTSNESKDLEAVVDFAKDKYKKIYLIGFSLGGAISIIYSASCENINRLVVVSAPHSFDKINNSMWIKDFIQNPFKKYEAKICVRLRPSPIIRKKIKPFDVIDSIKAPTLFIVGDCDSIICPNDTISLFYKAKCKKKLELFSNCNHAEDLICQAKDKLFSLCEKWLLN